MGLVLGVLLLLFSIPFIYKESQKKVELYVNPAFKTSGYDSFYIERGEDSVDELTIGDRIDIIFTAGGLSRVSDEVTSKTLYITLKIEKGFIFPPNIGHFNPEIFFPKTLLIEIYNNKSKTQLLFKLYTWRGVFSDGYGVYEKLNFLVEGLRQAGWEEKKYNILLHLMPPTRP